MQVVGFSVVIKKGVYWRIAGGIFASSQQCDDVTRKLTWGGSKSEIIIFRFFEINMQIFVIIFNLSCYIYGSVK